MDDLPVQPGTYALILQLAESKPLNVGKLGRFEPPPGIYVYLGSARGPGGLRGRLGRHLRGDGKRHWHIDHLVSVSVVKGIGYIGLGAGVTGCSPTECSWSQAILVLPGASIPIPKFGASDCRSGCPAHLIHFAETGFLDELPTDLYPSGGCPEAKMNFNLLPD
jgi:Uri superfamily endonuclease